MSSIMGPRGQITIEKEIRRSLGLEAGWRAVQRRVGDQVVISFRPPSHRRSLLGILGGPDVPQLDEETFRTAVDEAWDRAAHEACASSGEQT